MKYISLIIILCFSTIALSQSSKNIKEQAKAYIAAAHYQDAINVLKTNRQLSNKDEEGRFLIAVCYYQLNDLSAANSILKDLVNNEKSPYPECWFYLGKIFHAQQQFQKAIQNYKTYLRLLRPDHPNRSMLVEEIRRCDNGLRLKFKEAQTIVENLGEKVNSKGDEFGPIISPNRSTQLYFSAIKEGNTGGARDQNTRPDESYGQHLSDMFSTRLAGGQWQAPQALHYLLNTPQHEQLIGFSSHGNVLLYFKGWSWENGEIFADTFQQDAQRSLKTTPFIGPALGSTGEQSLFLHNDTLLIFASRKPGGYGGLDLYKSRLKNGRWSTPKNLGPSINSSFDETTPFLSRNGTTLYFSTNDSQKSIGGLDVVRSVYLEEAQKWSEPENLGFPVNSPADDAHFILANDGFTAFYSSAKKDGFGQRDLYIAYFTKYRKEMEAPISIAPVNNPIASGVTPEPNRKPRPRVNQPSPKPVTTTKNNWFSTASTLNGINPQPWINEVILAANKHQNDHIVLSCYLPAKQGEEKSKTLYDGIQFLKNLSHQIATKGVSSSRIFLRALSSDNNQFQLTASIAPQGEPTDTQLPIIGLNNEGNITRSPINQALVYKVQVMSVQRAYSNEKLSNQEFLMLENTASLPHLRYTARVATTYQKANQLRQGLINSGYNGAYIIPYLYGERIDKARATLFTSQFPDLLQYLGR